MKGRQRRKKRKKEDKKKAKEENKKNKKKEEDKRKAEEDKKKEEEDNDDIKGNKSLRLRIAEEEDKVREKMLLDGVSDDIKGKKSLRLHIACMDEVYDTPGPKLKDYNETSINAGTSIMSHFENIFTREEDSNLDTARRMLHLHGAFFVHNIKHDSSVIAAAVMMEKDFLLDNDPCLIIHETFCAEGKDQLHYQQKLFQWIGRNFEDTAKASFSFIGEKDEDGAKFL